MKNGRLKAVPDGCTMKELEFRAVAIIGNVHDDEIYAGDFEDLADVVKQLYNKADRNKIANPFLAPKTVRYGGKADLLNLQAWVYKQWLEGTVCTGWIHHGAKWGTTFWPPLSAYVKNLFSMRRAC